MIMPRNPQEFAEILGAKLIGEVPDTGGGPFGMARLAHIMHQRLTPSLGERPGRPTDANWESRPKVPMSEATRKQLEEIAKQVSTPMRQVSPMQVAAQLLEEAVHRVQESAARVEDVTTVRNGPATKVKKIKQAPKRVAKRRGKPKA
jgi:hypothetical protein